MKHSLKHLGFVTIMGIGLAVLSQPTMATAGNKIVVNPGESIQDAVDAALPGDKILVMPGTYVETHGGTAAVRVNKSRIKLIAKSNIKKGDKVIVEPGPGNTHGIVAEPDAGQPDIEKYLIKGFTVQGFDNNGIQTEHVNRFKIIGNESIDNAENGIFPVLSANGLVKRNVSYGSDDSALWVEGSENVRVLRNELHSSPTGLEVTISNDVVLKKNDVHDNVVGIGLYHPHAASEDPLDGPMLNWRVEKNHVHDNNLPNPVPPGGLVGNLPTGGGVLILGVDGVTLRKNLVENNHFYGVAIVNWCLAVDGTAFSCDGNPTETEPPEQNQFPQGNRIEDNTFVDNGLEPPPHVFAPLAADMIDAVILPPAVAGNCYEGNEYTTYKSTLGGGTAVPNPCS